MGSAPHQSRIITSGENGRERVTRGHSGRRHCTAGDRKNQADEKHFGIPGGLQREKTQEIYPDKGLELPDIFPENILGDGYSLW